MRRTVKVKVQTGLFARTACKLKVAPESLTLTPDAKGDGIMRVHAANVKLITFYEQKLKMEIQTDGITDVYFTNKDDWLAALKALKETLDVKIVCEFN